VGVIDTRIARPAPKTADPFYLSPEWRKLVSGLIAKRGRRCEACGKTSGDDGQPVRLIGDHVHELRDGGAPLDEGNVRLVCQPCHNVKTAKARAERMARR
jgi:5-methylcytosine-specific restriction endonuclease McrA